jgi:general secretion pathway protein G
MILRTKPFQLRAGEVENPVARAAFTLMEMLIVVAIIVALAGLGGYYFIGQLNEAKKKTAKVQANEITKACETYAIDHGQYPQQLEQLLQRDNFGGPYLKNADALRDPWGNPYRYNAAGTNSGGTQPDVWAEVPGVGQIGNWTSVHPGG